MASDTTFMAYVLDQIGQAGQVSSRKMFGEYAVYCDGKVVALVCDNQFYLKPTVAARALLGVVTEAPPYPGAKPYWLMSEQLDEQQLMANLVRLTASELPLPKTKPAKVAKPTQVAKPAKPSKAGKTQV